MKAAMKVKVPLIVLGFSSIATQLLLARELLSIFYGNELVFGILLANWLLLTGLGARLGKHTKKGSIPLLEILIGILPALLLLSTRHLRSLFLPGTLLGIPEIFLLSFLILLPFCLLTGYALPFFVNFFPNSVTS